MRRPPDKESQPSLSERDVDSSNATLNTLFGGSRQKSWMVGAGAPVRPTPRTNPAKQSQEQPAAMQRGNEASSSIRQTAINGEEKESQRRIFTGESVRQNNSITATFPQGALSSTIDTAQHHLPISWTQREDSGAATQREPSSARQPRELIDASNHHLSRGLSDNLPLPSSLLQPSYHGAPGIHGQEIQSSSSRVRTSDDFQPRKFPPNSHSPASGGVLPGNDTTIHQSIQSQSVQARSLTQHNVSPLSSPRPLSRPARPNAMRAQAQQSQSPQIRQIHIPSPLHTLPITANSESTTDQNAQRHHPPQGSFQSNPNKRQRVHTPTMPSLKTRLGLINVHIENSGGLMSLNHGLERPRFLLLKDACNNEDRFYVALHQVFCMWDFDRNQVVRIERFPAQPVLELAFKILGQLIRDNEQLAHNHRKYFATFPSPLMDLLRTSEPYRQTINDVGAFLEKLSSEWTPWSHECTVRGYPPLVDELIHRMGILSPILQGVVFTATRRNLGIGDDQTGRTMEELFRKDRRQHLELSGRFNSARPPTAKEIDDRNKTLIQEYLHLHSNLVRQRRSSVRGIPSSTGPNTVLQEQPPPLNLPQTQREADGSPWQTAIASPDLGGNRQFANPQIQAVRRTASGSPIPSSNSIVGRPPSVTSQRGYAETPSPTLVHNLSLHSPMQQNFHRSSAEPTSLVAPILRSNFPIVQSHQIPITSTSEITVPPRPNSDQNGSPRDLRQSELSNAHQEQQHQAMAIQHQQMQAVAAQHNMQQLHQITNLNNTQLQQTLAHQHLQNMQNQHRFSLSTSGHPQRRNSNPTHGVGSRIQPSTGSISSNGRRTPGTHGAMNRPTPQASRSNTAAIMSQIQLYNQTHPLDRPLVPPEGFVNPPQAIAPEITALHQSHLRSPLLVPVELPATIKLDDPSRRFYQTVKGFALAPTQIKSSVPLTKYEFTITPATHALLPKDTLGTGQIATRKITRGTLQCRLRCIKRKKDETKVIGPDWIIDDTAWPEGACLDINRQQLEIRRKNHHGKDLAIDITAHVRSFGPNVINQVTIAIPNHRRKFKDVNYWVAVEVIEILQHQQIINSVIQHQRKPAATILDAIKRSLVAPVVDDGDDFAMVTSDLSIDLADPFTARIFETPVRGQMCLHRECFDLETFLLTRNSKPKRPDQPCMIDVWKCPLCGLDARPYSLHVDEFLAEVRADLKARDSLDVKAIWIGPDGNWRPKEEARSGKRKATAESDFEETDSESDTELHGKSDILTKEKSKSRNRIVEVIELD